MRLRSFEASRPHRKVIFLDKPKRKEEKIKNLNVKKKREKDYSRVIIKIRHRGHEKRKMGTFQKLNLKFKGMFLFVCLVKRQRSIPKSVIFSRTF